MFGALICYVINARPEVPRLCKMLDGVARQMVKNKPLKEMKFHVEKILPDIQRLLESQDDLIPLSKFTPVDPLAHQVDPLELSPETTSLNRKDQIQCLRTDGIELDSEGTRWLAYKRRRLSL
jgi:hypothetical protein